MTGRKLHEGIRYRRMRLPEFLAVRTSMDTPVYNATTGLVKWLISCAVL